jgi:hypothetical protein
MERRMIELLRDKRFSLLLAALFIGYLAYTRMPDIFEPRFIPPHDNGDGTVDYTLVTRNPKLEEKHLWIIRLPKEVWAELSEDGRIGDVSINGGPAIGFNSIANRNLQVAFWAKDMSPYLKDSGQYPILNDQLVRVSLDFASRWPSRWNWGPSISDIERACLELPRPSQNVRAFRGKLPPATEGYCPVRADNKYSEVAYLLYRENKKLSGHFRCFNHPNQNQKCHGSILLTQRSDADVFYSGSFLPPDQLEKTISAVQEFFDHATVLVESVPNGRPFSVGVRGN